MPGEYCPLNEHGQSGIAADGEPIICENQGVTRGSWLWQPAN
jgi:hypothetical protein